jgi:hypothetical protein
MLRGLGGDALALDGEDDGDSEVDAPRRAGKAMSAHRSGVGGGAK